jgi:hypothetical protein
VVDQDDIDDLRRLAELARLWEGADYGKDVPVLPIF